MAAILKHTFNPNQKTLFIMEVLDQQNEGGNGKSLETVLSEGYSFNMGDYISGAFKQFGNDAGSYIGFTILYFVISMVIGAIPFVGTIAGLIVNPPILVGIYIFARLHKKGSVRSFNNFFDGFKGNWIQYALQSFVTGLIVALAVFVVIAPFFLTTIIELVGNADRLENMQDQEELQAFMLTLLTGKILLGILLAMLVGSAIAVLYVFAPMFIAFRGMTFWDAMEASRKVVSKNYVQFLIMMIVLMLIGFVGVLLCCVGLLVAMPVIYIAIYLAFEEIMGSGDVMENTQL